MQNRRAGGSTPTIEALGLGSALLERSGDGGFPRGFCKGRQGCRTDVKRHLVLPMHGREEFSICSFAIAWICPGLA